MSNDNALSEPQKNNPENDRFADFRIEIKCLSDAVNKALRRAQKKINYQILERQEALCSARYKQQADSILANLRTIPSWSESCEILNVHTNETETIKLNAKLSPKGNAELLYKKARKGVRGMAIIENRLKETNILIGALEAAARDLLRISKSELPDTRIRDEFASLNASLAHYVIGHRVNQGVMRPKALQPKHMPYRHITLESWDILIGRSSAQNDELITRFAKPSDIWLHIAAHSGSHVVVRRNKNSEWPPADILEIAASFAVWFSAAKHASNAEVHVAEMRFVSKRRHLPAGQVIVTQFKTMYASPLSPQNYFREHPEIPIPFKKKEIA
jgi:predicted ribosome quality control (RQC) complex YloA/Tae2 family protein